MWHPKFMLRQDLTLPGVSTCRQRFPFVTAALLCLRCSCLLAGPTQGRGSINASCTGGVSAWSWACPGELVWDKHTQPGVVCSLCSLSILTPCPHFSSPTTALHCGTPTALHQ